MHDPFGMRGGGKCIPGIRRAHALAAALAVLAAIVPEAAAQLPAPGDVVAFHADSVPADRPPELAGFVVGREDLLALLADASVVPADDWHGDHSHVAGADRTGTITLRDGAVVGWLARPGGLARLTLPDGTRLHLVAAPGLSASDVRALATRHRDAWMASHPDEGGALAESVVTSVERAAEGWHVTFEARTGESPDTPEGLHVYYLHVYLDAEGALLRIERGPDAIP
jgi:hypothetical protein